MDNNDVGDISLKAILIEAIKGNPKFVALLLEHPWVIKLINEIATWAQGQFQKNQDETKQFLREKIWKKIGTVLKPDPSSFRSWCYSVTNRHYLNVIRRSKGEKRCLDEITRWNQDGRRKTAGGGVTVVQPATVLTPEHEFLINEGVRRALKSFPRDIVEGFALRLTPKEIAEATGIPVKTIYRILKQMQQAITEETGLQPCKNKTKSATRQKGRKTIAA